MSKKIDWKKRFEEEQKSKRQWINRYVDLVLVSRQIASLQPASIAKNKEEADLFVRFYRELAQAPVTFGNELSLLPSDDKKHS